MYGDLRQHDYAYCEFLETLCTYLQEASGPVFNFLIDSLTHSLSTGQRSFFFSCLLPFLASPFSLSLRYQIEYSVRLSSSNDLLERGTNRLVIGRAQIEFLCRQDAA